MQEFVNEIIKGLQDNPEMAAVLGGAAIGTAKWKGREAVSYTLDEVSKAVYDPVSYSTNDLKEVEGPIRGYLADRRIKWDEENFGSGEYSVQDD